MSHDFTYLNQLTVEDLLDRAHRGNWTGPEAHMIRALAIRLEDYLEFRDMVNNLEAELGDAERRAEGWREEAQAVQRQLDMVRG
jgi:ABC-type lipoprotein release transport system permease subunit